jgi:hypothetical protein
MADSAGNEMAAQPPGERHLLDYVSMPISTLAAPFKNAPGMMQSVPGLFYASTWADGHDVFLPVDRRSVVGAAAIAALLGVVPTVVFFVGLVQILRRPGLRAALAWPLLYAALLHTAFLVQTGVVPRYSAVKSSYLLSALLPTSFALAAGLTSVSHRARDVLRAALLTVAAYSTFITWYGWWQ